MYTAKLLLFVTFTLPGILCVSNLIRIACNRNPSAHFCPPAKARSSSLFVEPPPNLYLRDSASEKKHSAGLLIDDLEANAPSKGDEESTTPRSPFAPEVGSVTEYCKKYRKHNSYFCQKAMLSKASDNLKQFCDSYTSNCGDFLATAAGSAGGEEETPSFPSGGSSGGSDEAAPGNPFEGLPGVGGGGGGGKSGTSTIFEKFQSQGPKPLIENKELERLKKKRPCTADCDPRIWKHCTHDCKCDHDYPYVQKFCNPPPLPMFLMTCRLWYALCPKYEAYHYASQFIYSKAEKGKVLPGTDVNLAKAQQQKRGFVSNGR
ncbi:hypothetical protein L596_016110 [Steinernema carpocapsae]|uniref:Uncharacterized protein n=1 Tax=Steinernema carpocapsae TaxID=34508 RepID=A0A4U5NI36_STECR|nr:hypothetical protein L596_016110 [Steinernema carpocapsae]